MDILMHVHRVGMSTAPMNVEIAGEATSVMVPRFEVELTNADGHGTMVLRFMKPSEIAAAKEKFVVDQDVPMSF